MMVEDRAVAVSRAGLVLALVATTGGCRDGRPTPAAPMASGPPAASSADASGPAVPVVSDRTSVLTNGLALRKLELDRTGARMSVWIYRQPAAHGPRPVVLIAPAGTPLIWGSSLANEPGTEDERENDEHPERLPWANRGYVVVAYSLDGPVVNDEDEREITAGVVAFLSARAGLDNARTALDVVLEREPGLDRGRVLAVGHSSAATLALRVGAEEPRVTAVVAFNPATDVLARLGPMVDAIDEAIPGGRAALVASEPLRHAAALRAKPVFLFHSVEDNNVPVADSDRLAEAMKPAHPRSRYARVDHGDHYLSMIEQGIPLALDWADGLAPAAAGLGATVRQASRTPWPSSSE